MWRRLKSGDRKALAAATIALALVFFFALNILSATALKRVQIDLTADGAFTLTAATRNVLAGIDEPIRLRYYRSEGLDRFGPFLARHAQRVDELLERYARLAGGKLLVERYDPAPYSPEEDLAVADGIQGVAAGDGGSLVYFGIAGTNSTDDRRAIPYLAPERAAFLEYDLTRLVYDLAHPEKPVVAVIGDAPLSGDPLSRSGPWLITDSMQQLFTLRTIGGSVDRIGDDVDVVLLAQPAGIDEVTLYALDQFVLRGGRLLAFVDPHPEALALSRPGAKGDGAVEALEPLLSAWGVEMASDKVVGDRRAAMRVRARHDGRPVITDYLAWLMLTEANLAAGDAATGDLRLVVMKSAGAVRGRAGATTTIEPLIFSSTEAAEIEVDAIRFLPDPVALLQSFEPTGQAFPLAVRIRGPVTTAFPDGPPADLEGEEIRAAHQADAAEPVDIVLVGDVDMLADEAWAETRSILGQDYAVPTANNADFVLAALEHIAGGAALAGLGGRGVMVRPFEVVDAMLRTAEDEYRATEETLLARIEETRIRIGELQNQEQEGGVLLTTQQQETLDAFRGELIELRGQLREVQFALRKDVAALETRLKILNIWVVPFVVAVAAIVLAAARRKRAARFHAEART